MVIESDAAGPHRYQMTTNIPTTADTIVNVQMARCGVSLLPCKMPKCDGTSSSRTMA